MEKLYDFLAPFSLNELYNEKLNVTKNGTYVPKPGIIYNPIFVNVQPPLETKVITTLGIHNVTDYKQVEIPTSSIDPANIKKGVSVLGVVGTFEGKIYPVYDGSFEVIE